MDTLRDTRARGVGQILHTFDTPNFWRIWTGSMIWYTARWMDLFVLQWTVLVMTDSAFQVTLVGFYRMAPMFLFGIFTGLLADRIDRRPILLLAQLGSAVASAILGFLALTDRLALWHLAILVTIVGIAWTLDLPSRRSIIFDMVGSPRVVNAMALDHVGMDGAKMLGPILGGLLWPVIGAGGCMFILSGAYLVTFWLYRGLPPAPPTHRSDSTSVTRNLAQGLAYVWRHPVILGVLVITAAMNLLGFPYQQLVSVVAKQALDLGPRLTGLLFAADGLGAFSASLVLATYSDIRPKGRVFALGSLTLMAAVLCFSFSRWYPLSWLLLLCAGAGTACFATLQSSTILLSASPDMRGRAMGTLILAIGFGPLGALGIGLLASLLGAPLAISITAGSGLLLLALLIRKARGLWEFRGGA
jgi:MFS family permease